MASVIRSRSASKSFYPGRAGARTHRRLFNCKFSRRGHFSETIPTGAITGPGRPRPLNRSGAARRRGGAARDCDTAQLLSFMGGPLNIGRPRSKCSPPCVSTLSRLEVRDL